MSKDITKSQASSSTSFEEVEDDYMSESFLTGIVDNDIRPGLIFNRTKQREYNIEEKKITKHAEIKLGKLKKGVLEQQRREEGLKESISSENKGFALLQKMGYKPGTAIGKSGQGIVVPVSITLKSGRQGLGREAALHEIAAYKKKIRAQHVQEREKAMDPETFRSRISQIAQERQIISDLRKSQRICEQLDKEQDITEACHSWFWPEREKDVNEEEKDKDIPSPTLASNSGEDDSVEQEKTILTQETADENLLPSEQLMMLTIYLRGAYSYCLWCGTKYDDEKDLETSCPGSQRDDH